MMRRRLVKALAVAVMGIAATAPARADDSLRPVVVELFTSQGCSSCPPADEFLHELATRADVIALTFNVDIWDYLGWVDNLAKREFSLRQQAYAQAMPARQVYTPQAVIMGAMDTVGSRRDEVNALIDAALGEAITRPAASIAIEDDTIRISVAADPMGVNRDATVLFIRKLAERDVNIGQGENGGRIIRYANVVRQMIELGRYDGSAVSFDVSRGENIGEIYDGYVVLVQERRADGGPGRILAAAMLEDASALSLAGGN